MELPTVSLSGHSNLPLRLLRRRHCPTDCLFGQAGIHKLLQNFRRRITGHSKVVIEFPVIGFFRCEDGWVEGIFDF